MKTVLENCTYLHILVLIFAFHSPVLAQKSNKVQKIGKVIVHQGIPEEILGKSTGPAMGFGECTEEETEPKQISPLDGINNAVLPEYPTLALRKNQEGIVYVTIYQKKTGEVYEVKILKGEKIFADAVKQAVKGWKFPSSDFEMGRYYTFKFTIESSSR